MNRVVAAAPGLAAYTAWKVWTTVLISDEEFEYVQMALLSCCMDWSATIGVSWCCIAMLIQCKEFHNV